MRTLEKYHNNNNNSDNPLTSRRTDGGKKYYSLSEGDKIVLINRHFSRPVSVNMQSTGRFTEQKRLIDIKCTNYRMTSNCDRLNILDIGKVRKLSS